MTAKTRDIIEDDEQEEVPKKKRKNVRTMGHNFERELVLIFKNLGFNKCATSKYANRLLDDCKVDLANLPLNIQAKKGYNTNRPKADVIFKEMSAHLDANFMEDNPQLQYPKVLFHKIDGKCKENHLVTMMFHEWVEMYKKSLEWDKYQKSLKNG